MSDQIVMQSLENISSIFTEYRKESREDNKIIKDSLQTAEKNSTEAWKDIKKTRERVGIVEKDTESLSKKLENNEDKIEEIEKNMIRIWGNGSQNPTGVIALMQKDIKQIKEGFEKAENSREEFQKEIIKTIRELGDKTTKKIDEIEEKVDIYGEFKTKITTLTVAISAFVGIITWIITMVIQVWK